jgi:type III secretory pathway component EscV
MRKETRLMDNLPNLPVYAFQANWGGLLSLILTVLLPLAVAVITTRVTSARAKFLWLLLVVAVKTTVEALIANNNDVINFAWIPFLMNLIINVLLAGMAHFIAWKPTGLAAKIQSDVGVKAIDGETYHR